MKKIGESIFLLNEIENICNLDIKENYKLIIIKELIDRWRK